MSIDVIREALTKIHERHKFMSAGRDMQTTMDTEQALATLSAMQSPDLEKLKREMSERFLGKRDDYARDTHGWASQQSLFSYLDHLHSIGLLRIPQEEPLMGKRFAIEHDGFTGTVIGGYITKEGKHGVVLQQDGTRVVHVYGQKWLKEPL